VTFELVCADMKATRAKTVDVDAVDDIIETLKRVQGTAWGRTRISARVGSSAAPNGKQKTTSGKRPSLLDTRLWMWADREDIMTSAHTQLLAEGVRTVETRKNVR